MAEHRLVRAAAVRPDSTVRPRWCAPALLRQEDVGALLSLARALAGAVEHTSIAVILADEVRRLTGAARVVVWELTQGRELQAVVESSCAPPVTRRMSATVARISSPEWDALRALEPVWICSRDDARNRYAGARLDPAGAVSPSQAWAFLPSMADAEAAGVLAFAFTQPREFGPHERAFLSEIAAECGSALARGTLFTRERSRADASDAAHVTLEERFRESECLVSERTRLYERERFARVRAEAETAQARQSADELDRAQKLLAALAAAGSERQVSVTLAAHAAEAFHAFGVAVTRRVGATELEIVRTLGLPAEVAPTGSRLPIDGSTPEGDVVRSGSPLWLESREEVARRYPRAAEVLLRLGSAAWLGVPILSEAGIAGTLALTFRATRIFSTSERAHLVRLAVQCAAALHRGGSLDVKRTADELVQACATPGVEQQDHFALLREELRIPLQAIALAVKRLERGELAPAELGVLESISASLDRMNAAVRALVAAPAEGGPP
jgi:GAF domain-containing protein